MAAIHFEGAHLVTAVLVEALDKVGTVTQAVAARVGQQRAIFGKHLQSLCFEAARQRFCAGAGQAPRLRDHFLPREGVGLGLRTVVLNNEAVNVARQGIDFEKLHIVCVVGLAHSGDDFLETEVREVVQEGLGLWHRPRQHHVALVVFQPQIEVVEHAVVVAPRGRVHPRQTGFERTIARR